MIQQSQLQTKAMFQEPDNFHFQNTLLPPEQPKIGLILQSEEEFKVLSPELSQKYSKKSSSKDSPRPRKQKGFEDSNTNQKFGHWNMQENKLYHWFLQIHNKHFLNRHLRRTDKIFKSMALFVGSREAEQCRSHHQKMEKKHHSICNILACLRKQHYGYQKEDLLIQDLRQNKVEVIDQILSGRFLQEQRMNSVCQGQNIQGQKNSHEQQQIVQEVVYELVNFQQKLSQQHKEQDEDQIHLLPVKMQCFDKDLIQMLLCDEAPHNNYLMI